MGRHTAGKSVDLQVLRNLKSSWKYSLLIMLILLWSVGKRSYPSSRKPTFGTAPLIAAHNDTEAFFSKTNQLTYTTFSPSFEVIC